MNAFILTKKPAGGRWLTFKNFLTFQAHINDKRNVTLQPQYYLVTMRKYSVFFILHTDDNTYLNDTGNKYITLVTVMFVEIYLVTFFDGYVPNL